MAFGSWKSPFPFRFGGGTRKVAGAFHEQMRAGRPDVLRGSPGTYVDVENKTAARMLWMAHRAVGRRVAQRDPTRLSDDVRPVRFPDSGETKTISMLERWELILLLHPAPGDSLQARRAAVAAHFSGFASNNLKAVTQAMLAVFGSWLLLIGTNTVAEVNYAGESPPGNVTAYWANGSFTFSAEYPGQFNPDFPWLSGLAHIVVVIAPPINLEQSKVDVRIGAAQRVLDDLLPAWMTFDVSQLPPDQTEPGFFADISKVGQTAV